MQEVSVLRCEQEDQAIDEPEQLAEEVGESQFAAIQSFAQTPIIGMREKAVAEAEQGGFDSVAPPTAPGDAPLLPGLPPPLKITIGWQRAGLPEAACVNKQPERSEIGEALLLEDRAEIGFDIGGPYQA